MHTHIHTFVYIHVHTYIRIIDNLKKIQQSQKFEYIDECIIVYDGNKIESLKKLNKIQNIYIYI